MMKQIFLLIFVICTFASIGQNSDMQKAIIANMEPFHVDVDVIQAKNAEYIQAGNLVFIDIRTPEEIAYGKIKGALELNYKSPDFKERIAALDKTKQYMVYCYAGGLSSKAMNLMKELGFKQVYNLEPGYKAWLEADISVENR